MTSLGLYEDLLLQTCREMVSHAVPGRVWSFPNPSIPQGAAGFPPLLPPAPLGPKQEQGDQRAPKTPGFTVHWTPLLPQLRSKTRQLLPPSDLNVTPDQETPAKTGASGEQNGHWFCSAGPLSCLKVDSRSHSSLYLCDEVTRGKNKVQLPAYLGISLNKYK